MRDGKRARGWMYHTEGVTPQRIVVQLRDEKQVEQPKKDFEDSQEGAEKADKWVTEQLGRDDWKLEPTEMKLLGWRIVIPTDVGVTSGK